MHRGEPTCVAIAGVVAGASRRPPPSRPPQFNTKIVDDERARRPGTPVPSCHGPAPTRSPRACMGARVVAAVVAAAAAAACVRRTTRTASRSGKRERRGTGTASEQGSRATSSIFTTHHPVYLTNDRRERPYSPPGAGSVLAPVRTTTSCAWSLVVGMHAELPGKADGWMTPEDRYLFDVQGKCCLHSAASLVDSNLDQERLTCCQQLQLSHGAPHCLQVSW
eukprot:COSAG03_NODE_273_length_9568_cov_33.245644_6_plen_222_part_00